MNVMEAAGMATSSGGPGYFLSHPSQLFYHQTQNMASNPIIFHHGGQNSPMTGSSTPVPNALYGPAMQPQYHQQMPFPPPHHSHHHPTAAAPDPMQGQLGMGKNIFL